ncbi:MAG: hypothetical protein ABSG98_00785 [Anaerolineales bacterium]
MNKNHNRPRIPLGCPTPAKFPRGRELGGGTATNIASLKVNRLVVAFRLANTGATWGHLIWLYLMAR